MHNESLNISSLSYSLGFIGVEKNDIKKERRLQHRKEKMVAEKAFKELTLLYKWGGDFGCASAYRLNEMVHCLKLGFQICNSKQMYERWAFEVMPGCLRSLQKKREKQKIGRSQYERTP